MSSKKTKNRPKLTPTEQEFLHDLLEGLILTYQGHNLAPDVIRTVALARGILDKFTVVQELDQEKLDKVD